MDTYLNFMQTNFNNLIAQCVLAIRKVAQVVSSTIGTNYCIITLFQIHINRLR